MPAPKRRGGAVCDTTGKVQVKASPPTMQSTTKVGPIGTKRSTQQYCHKWSSCRCNSGDHMGYELPPRFEGTSAYHDQSTRRSPVFATHAPLDTTSAPPHSPTKCEIPPANPTNNLMQDIFEDFVSLAGCGTIALNVWDSPASRRMGGHPERQQLTNTCLSVQANIGRLIAQSRE